MVRSGLLSLKLHHSQLKPFNVLLASFVALAAIHTASAQTVSRITGSTAYRVAVYDQAITVAGQLATDLTTTSASGSGILLTG
jgi:hypothetical protein